MEKKSAVLLLGLFLLLFSFSCAPRLQVVKTEVEQKPKVVPKNVVRTEFEILMERDSIAKHQTAAESLDILLNSNDSEKISLIVYNESNCDLILRFTGTETYNLPIYKRDKNFIVLTKGNYTLKGKLCRAFYDRKKEFRQSSTLRIMEGN
ncbi:DUF6759 domain-containing protein [Chryseobacterium sp. A301]